ncbi:T9SS C-terminal target domain-containing protein, partial [bacterium]
YYWRVRGRNVAGYGPYSPIWNFTTIVAAPAAVTLSSPSDGAAGISTSPMLSWAAVSGALTYHVQLSSTSGFATRILDDSIITTTSRQVSSLTNNTTCYWRVRGKNAGGYGPFSSTCSFTTIPVYPSNLTANVSLTFPAKTKANEYTAQEYRLIGLPGSSDILAKDIVTGVQNEDWEIVWDNGAASDYLKRYDGSANFKFNVGKAFWAISRIPLSIIRTVPSATLNTAQEVEIPVKSGWNLITNPFDKSIPWSRIQTTNGISGAIYSFNGAFNNATTLDPYAGYYFFNGTPSPVLTTLRVPYSSAFGKLTELEQKKESGWRMVVEGSFQDAEGRMETIEIGVESDAKDGLDALDQRMPRSLEKASLYFDRTEWDRTYSEFGKDIKAESNQLKKWEFTVEGKLLEKKLIRATGMETIPESDDVVLVDRERGLVVDLRQREEYSVEMVKGKMAFSVMVGRREIVEAETEKLMPTEVKVGPNYPNPFNPETIIPIELPKTMEVRIVVYDILGRTIRTLHDGIMESGRHYVRWNGRDELQRKLASGVYLYRVEMSAERRIVSGKVTLVQ